MNDSRRRERVGFSLATQIFEPDGAVRDTVSMNLSEGGLFIATKDPPAEGERRKIKVTSLYGVGLLSGSVEVRWRSMETRGDHPAGFGAEWVALELQDTRDIKTVVRSAFDRDAILEELKCRTAPARLKEKIEGIHGRDLSSELQEFVDEYGKWGERHAFLWRWVCKGLELTALSSVDPQLSSEVLGIKFLGVMFDVMLDDAADQIQDRALVDQMLLISFESSFVDRERIPPQFRDYFDFTARVWKEIEHRTRRLPRHAEFEDLLEFDYRQLLNCMRYALIVNIDPARLNNAEHDLYQPHNMHMMINALIDIMASPAFEKREIGLLREAIWNAQVMGRIGNAVSTWQREIKDRDFTSGVFSLALSDGVLDPGDLLSEDLEAVEGRLVNSGIEERLLVHWGRRRDRLEALSARIRSVDLGRLINGLEELISLHLGSRGLK